MPQRKFFDQHRIREVGLLCYQYPGPSKALPLCRPDPTTNDWVRDALHGTESLGFIVEAALAYKLGAGFSIVRKPGKLPYETHSASYELEYGKDTLEIHIDAIAHNARVGIAMT